MAKKNKQLKEGTKYDSGKIRWDLFPYGAIEQVAEVYTGGATKYDDWNWAKGIKFSRIFAATMRHLMSFWWHRKSWNEEDFGLHHLAHAIWGLLALLHYELNYEKYKKYDDRRKDK